MAIEGPPFVTLVHQTDGIPVVKVSGEIDLQTAERFMRALSEAMTEAGDAGDGVSKMIVVDLSGVGFMDSCGVSALAASTRKFRGDGGEVRIVTKDSPVSRTLGITGLHRVFDIFPDVNSAAGRGVA